MRSGRPSHFALGSKARSERAEGRAFPSVLSLERHAGLAGHDCNVTRDAYPGCPQLMSFRD